jgi:hypothetical protein
VKGDIVSVLSEARHRGAITCHVAFAGELPTNGAPEGWVMREEAGVVDCPHEFLFFCELNVGEGDVFFVEQEIQPV